MDSGFFESDSAHIAIPFEKKVLRHRPQGGVRSFPPVEGLERNNLGYLWRVLQHFIEIFVRGMVREVTFFEREVGIRRFYFEKSDSPV